MTLSRSALFLLIAAFLIAWTIPVATRTLVRPDEGRYAEIAREMAVAGDYVTPRLNGLKYFEKPPLQYWATALAYRSFGESAFSTRLWPALTGLLGLVFTWFGVRTLVGREAAWATSAMLGAMTYYFFIAHINTLDMGLTAFMTLTLAGLLRGLSPRNADDRSARRWIIAAWAGAALAFLSKGLIGIVLPGAVFVLYVLITRQWQLLARLQWRWGPLVFLLIAAPWPILVQRANPEWAHFFFVYEHFERFASSEHDRFGSIFYFVPILLAGLLPWTPLAAGLLLRSGWRALHKTYRDDAAQFKLPLFLVIWCVFQFTFFSVSQSKLASYLLPITPALAMLLAPVWLQASDKAFVRYLVAMLCMPVTLAVAAILHQRFVSLNYTVGMMREFALYMAIAAVVLFGALWVAYWLNRKQRRLDALIVMAALSTIAASLTTTGYDALSPSTSSRQLVTDFLATEPGYQASDPFYAINMYEQTLPPYLKRTLTQVEYLDEMGLGAWMEPDKVRFNFDDFADEWRQQTRAYAVTDFDELPRLEMNGIPYRVVAADLRRVIIARHAQ